MKQSEAEKAYWEEQRIKREEYHDQINREHAANMKRWSAETPTQKAERTFKNIVITQHEFSTKYAWTKQNGGAWVPNEAQMFHKFCEDHKDLKERFMHIAIAYFEKHPEDVWVPRKEYIRLLPAGSNNPLTDAFSKVEKSLTKTA